MFAIPNGSCRWSWRMICPSTLGDRVMRRVGRATRAGGAASMKNPDVRARRSIRLVGDYAVGRSSSEVRGPPVLRLVLVRAIR